MYASDASPGGRRSVAEPQCRATAVVQNPLGGDDVRHIQTKLLPPDLDLTEQQALEGFALKTSPAERAALELLHLVSKEFDLVEAGMIIEDMTSIRPRHMQSLLEQCASIKVRRLFLYLTERANLPVERHLEFDRIDLGTGIAASYRTVAQSQNSSCCFPRNWSKMADPYRDQARLLLDA